MTFYAAARSPATEAQMHRAVKVYVRVAEIPRVYSISRAKVYRLAKVGRLTIHRLDGASLVKVADLTALIEGGTA